MSASLSYKPLDAAFGVEVDADLAKPFSPAQQAEVLRLFNEHGLVVFRGQTLGYHQQIRALSYLRRGRFIERDPEIVSNVGDVGFVGSTPLDFHSDSAFMPVPTQAISLHAIDVVDDASSTRFSNGNRTYLSLPEDLRKTIDGFHTVHVMPKEVFARNRLKSVPAHYPRTTRALVHRHEVTGLPVLYISWVMIDGILELSENESEALLDELHSYVSAPANVYEHRWRNGDVVMWDNVMLLHARDDTSKVGKRVLQRASTGAGHFSDIYPEFPFYAVQYTYNDA